jgi:hypothetical protein
MTVQASAGSNPESGAIFVATSTSNRVAVFRTLPEMVMSASETTRGRSAKASRRSLTCRVAELRAGSHSDAWGHAAFLDLRREARLQVG